MSTSRRRWNLRNLFSKSSAHRRKRQAERRKVLFTEQLEARTLMAADIVYNPYHNELIGSDVNRDFYVAPDDALAVINYLNAVGNVALPLSAQSGSGEDGPLKLDVNNDGFISPIDALFVINELNGEGEGQTVTFRLQPSKLDGTAITAPLNVGDRFLLRGFVKDSRLAPTTPGVFAAYLDVRFTDGLVTPDTREAQIVSITGDPTGGTFTLTFNGQTTAPIAVIPATDDGNGNITPAHPTPVELQNALEALSNINPGDVVVTRPNSPESPNAVAPANGYTVRFGGQYANQDVPQLTAAASLSGGTAPTVVVLNSNSGLSAETRSIVFGSSYGAGTAGTFSEAGATNVLNEIGATALTTTFLSRSEFQLFSVSMTARAPGVATFTGDPADVTPGHLVLVFGDNTGVPSAQIDFGTASVTIVAAVTPGNDSATVDEDSTNNAIAVLANDSVASGIKQIASFTNGTNGTVALDNRGTPDLTDDRLLYTPVANFAGPTDSFTYVLSNGIGNTATVTVNVTVNSINDAPVITLPNLANPPAANEDTALTFSQANGNMASFSDIDSGAGNVVLTLSVQNGTLALNPLGSIPANGNGTNSISITTTIAQVQAALSTVNLVYTPTNNSSGSDSLVLNLNDQGNTGSGGAKSDSKTVAITVNAVNDAPVNTVPGAQSVANDVTLPFSAGAGRLISIADVDAGAGNVQTTLTVANGVLNVTAGAGVGGNGTANLTLTGTVAAVNASLASLVYDPNNSFRGTETLTVTTNDQGNTGSGGAKTDVKTVEITVRPPIQPFANDDSPTPIAEDSAAIQINVRQNDIAHDNQQITLKSFTQPAAGGSVTLFTNGTPALTDDQLIFTPTADFNGTVTFTYTVNDTLEGQAGAGVDSTGTVIVRVTEVNDAPTALNDSFFAPEGQVSNLPASQVTGNDNTGPANENGQTLTITNVTGTSAGATIALNQDGTLRLTPNANFNGPFTFTYTIRDNGTTNGAADPKTATATATVTIAQVNDPPVAGTDTATTAEDTGLSLTAAALLVNDGPGGGPDEANQTLTITNVTAVSGGTVSYNQGTGAIQFTPAADFFGTAVLNYTLTDDGTSGGPTNPQPDPKSSTGTVNITVTPVNDVPVTTNDSRTTDTRLFGIKDFTRNLPAAAMLANDLPGPANESNQTLRITGVSVNSAQGGTVSLAADGSVNYTPLAGYTGPDSFTYTATDNGTTGANNAADPKSATGTVNLEVLKFIPSTVSGSVYMDGDGNGNRNGSEHGIASILVTLAGTDFANQPVNRSVRTTRGGAYLFDELAPGNYIVTARQATNLVDGLEHVGSALTIAGNDRLSLSIPIDGGVNSTGNNFGEAGFKAVFASMGSLLASKHNVGSIDNEPLNNGFMFSFSGSQLDWYIAMNGWDNFTPESLVFSGDRSSAVLTVVNGANQRFRATVTKASGRLRESMDANGNCVASVIGLPTASSINLTLANAGGEGEASDVRVEQLVAAIESAQREAEFADAVDAVMNQSNWQNA